MSEYFIKYAGDIDYSDEINKIIENATNEGCSIEFESGKTYKVNKSIKIYRRDVVLFSKSQFGFITAWNDKDDHGSDCGPLIDVVWRESADGPPIANSDTIGKFSLRNCYLSTEREIREGTRKRTALRLWWCMRGLIENCVFLGFDNAIVFCGESYFNRVTSCYFEQCNKGITIDSLEKTKTCCHCNIFENCTFQNIFPGPSYEGRVLGNQRNGAEVVSAYNTFIGGNFEGTNSQIITGNREEWVNVRLERNLPAVDKKGEAIPWVIVAADQTIMTLSAYGSEGWQSDEKGLPTAEILSGNPLIEFRGSQNRVTLNGSQMLKLAHFADGSQENELEIIGSHPPALKTLLSSRDLHPFITDKGRNNVVSSIEGKISTNKMVTFLEKGIEGLNKLTNWSKVNCHSVIFDDKSQFNTITLAGRGKATLTSNPIQLSQSHILSGGVYITLCGSKLNSHIEVSLKIEYEDKLGQKFTVQTPGNFLPDSIDNEMGFCISQVPDEKWFQDTGAAQIEKAVFILEMESNNDSPAGACKLFVSISNNAGFSSRGI